MVEIEPCCRGREREEEMGYEHERELMQRGKHWMIFMDEYIEIIEKLGIQIEYHLTNRVFSRGVWSEWSCGPWVDPWVYRVVEAVRLSPLEWDEHIRALETILVRIKDDPVATMFVAGSGDETILKLAEESCP